MGSTGLPRKEKGTNRDGWSGTDQHVHVPPGSHLIVSRSGHLPSGVAAELGLTREEAASVQMILSESWVNFSKEIASRVFYDRAASDPESGVDVYRIPALEDGGANLRESLVSKLKKVVGEEKARTLVENMSQEPFGSFGRYDVELKSYPYAEKTEATGVDHTQVTFKYHDPTTGKAVLEVTTTLEVLPQFFGYVFERTPEEASPPPSP